MPELDQSLAHAIREHVLRVLHDSTGPNEARQKLGVGRTTLYRWLRRWKAEELRERAVEREKENQREKTERENRK